MVVRGSGALEGSAPEGAGGARRIGAPCRRSSGESPDSRGPAPESPAEALPMAHTGSNARGLRAATSLLALILPAVAACSSGGGDGESGGASSGIAVNADLEAESLTARPRGSRRGSTRGRPSGWEPRSRPDPRLPDGRESRSMISPTRPTSSSARVQRQPASGAFETTRSIRSRWRRSASTACCSSRTTISASRRPTRRTTSSPPVRSRSPPAHPDLVAEAVSCPLPRRARPSTSATRSATRARGERGFRLGIYLELARGGDRGDPHRAARDPRARRR